MKVRSEPTTKRVTVTKDLKVYGSYYHLVAAQDGDSSRYHVTVGNSEERGVIMLFANEMRELACEILRLIDND